MDCTLLVFCFAALILPSLQIDVGQLELAKSRLARGFDNLKRSSAAIRGNLEFGHEGILGGIRGTAGSVEGVLRHSPTALGADLRGRVDNVEGNIFTGVRRNGVRGDISLGSGTSRQFPFSNSYTSGLLGSAFGRRCTQVPRSCLALGPSDRSAVRRFTFDERRNRCVEEFVSRTCARDGPRSSIFPNRRECRLECNSD
ncbi:hypothetical protein EGW08_012353 [Elysia chlorotica]|uniref:BPTI/Kunitz inhibitor domain-containing protein n=1 Tax=Elysia chlorotica TaxID=188477 RepID=A0A3S1BBV9_ELYCH|nr:hypothetical protein EGW08_012353 [Elysia chlorotica]